MADLNALVVFARVVDANSFSGAARRLQMPVSTVSRRIAELERDLGVRLLERSTRRLRLTDVGAEVLEHARRGLDVGDAVEQLVSHRRTHVTGQLRLSAPPSLADSLLTPLVCAFQAAYPGVRVRVLITERMVDPIGDSIDLAFRVGPLEDSTLVARRLLTYRHLLVASPAYLARRTAPAVPQDLLGHRLMAFVHARPGHTWRFTNTRGRTETLTFQPALAMNDFAGLAAALVAGAGIGDLPPIVQPALLRTGQLVEVMPAWRFRALDLALVRLGSRQLARPVRLFHDFALERAPTLFPALPT